VTGPGNRTHLATSNPSLVMVVTDDGSRTLKCLQTGLTWHSESGALAESRLVFLRNSGMEEKFARREPARVLELGFGTGLNFWITASLALRNKANLEYVSLEPNLLEGAIIQDLEHAKLADCQPAFDRFFPVISNQTDSAALKLTVADGEVDLTLCRQEFAQIVFAGMKPFDVIYHDPFGPETAPDLWTESTFQSLFRLLKPGGRLVTYCVKSAVQRNANFAGFLVRKTRGPVGGKREVLIAVRQAKNRGRV